VSERQRAVATRPAAQQQAPLVRLDAVSAGYGNGQPTAVEDITLTIHAGTFLGIVGPSGAGKTTLLRLLTGALGARAGCITRRTPLSVGYVPQVQSVDWTFPLTVTEAVLLARTASRWRPWPTAADRGDAARLLERLGIGALGDRHIRALSGGQQQRAFLARALVQDPDIVILDEPTSGVDLRTRHEVLHLLGDLHAEGLTIVTSTHDLNGVAAHLPEIACLNRRVVAHGDPRSVLTPEVLERTYDAPLQVLVHAGIPVVVDAGHARIRRAPPGAGARAGAWSA
jgi:zinc/manganese transport system ATP-binding protein